MWNGICVQLNKRALDRLDVVPQSHLKIRKRFKLNIPIESFGAMSPSCTYLDRPTERNDALYRSHEQRMLGGANFSYIQKICCFAECYCEMFERKNDQECVKGIQIQTKSELVRGEEAEFCLRFEESAENGWRTQRRQESVNPTEASLSPEENLCAYAGEDFHPINWELCISFPRYYSLNPGRRLQYLSVSSCACIL